MLSGQPESRPGPYLNAIGHDLRQFHPSSVRVDLRRRAGHLPAIHCWFLRRRQFRATVDSNKLCGYLGACLCEMTTMNFESTIRHTACFGILAMCLNGAVAAQYIESVRQAAEQGDATAQFHLGLMYANGDEIPEDDREAVKWFSEAAEQGIPKAQYHLALMYAVGEGVPEDDREAVKWFHKAADLGHAGAQFKLGVKYSSGDGVSEDDREGVKWFHKAAEQGMDKAQFILGVMYSLGVAVPEDNVKAYAWTNLAAAQGHSTSRILRGEIRTEMTYAQVAEAQRQSSELFNRIESSNSQ